MVRKIHIKESINRDIMSLPTSERAGLLIQFWDKLNAQGKHGHSTQEYYDWLESIGYDTSNYDSTTFNDIDWETALDILEIENEENPEYDDGINTKEDAYKWLQDKLNEYGNTYFFPNTDKHMLNKLIDRFGSTYFWNR